MDAPFLLGNTFPIALVRRTVKIEPSPLDELRAALVKCEWKSFWGHEDTINLVDNLLAIPGLTVRPLEVRPPLTLNEENLPTLQGVSYQFCWIVSPDYTPGFRPQIGEPVSPEMISKWQVLRMEWP